MRGRRMSKQIVIRQSDLYPLIGKLYVENLAYQRALAEMEEAHAAQEQQNVVPIKEGSPREGHEGNEGDEAGQEG